MSYPIFDSHAHYYDDKFDPDRDALLRSLPDKEVGWIVNASSDIATSVSSLELSREYPFIWFAAGVHPHEASSWDDGTQSRLLELLSEEKCVAVGEIGLDYHYDFSPREKQREVFVRQLETAAETGLPVVIHDREAHGDMYDILRSFAPLRGVMHCFSGSAELMEEAVRLGLHIGLGGPVTFQNAVHPVEVARAVPLERLLLETDCPYMTPVPHRGKRNDSSFISLVAEKIAQVRGCAPDDIRRQTAENAAQLFDIPLGMNTSE